MDFDVQERNTRPPIAGLTAKQFSLLLYLALRRTDGGDGWVEPWEIVARVAHWYGQKTTSVGKEIARFSTYPWFRLIEANQVTKGPWRLIPEASFLPGRDAANQFLSTLHMPLRAHRSQPPRGRQLTAAELQAYDLLTQRGVFMPAVVDLVLQRLGDPEHLRDPLQRLVAFRVLATLHRHRGNPVEARPLGEKGLRLAKRLKRKDEIAYFSELIAATHYLEGALERARILYDEGLAFLRAWGTSRATFHMTGLYRGLAATLAMMGLDQAALEAIAESRGTATAADDQEGVRLATLFEARIKGVPLPACSPVPAEHVVARVMQLNHDAEQLLELGQLEEGATLLRQAFADAQRLGLRNEISKAESTAERFEIRWGS